MTSRPSSQTCPYSCRSSRRPTCSQHHGRVAVVGAADDGGDDQRAVGQLVLLARVLEGDLGLQPVGGHVEAFEAHLAPGGGRVEDKHVDLEPLSVGFFSDVIPE